MANDFEGLFAARKKGRPDNPIAAETEPAAAAAPPPALPAQVAEPSPLLAPEIEPQSEPVIEPVAEPALRPTKKKRGRPATGKRSDAGWIGRTYYIQEKTDIEIEIELAMMRRQGVALDKSELVDALLGAWVTWRKGEDANSQIGEFSPRRKDS